ncbi:hypothetical protein ES705_16575 [subsurface metagenome]
MSEAETQVKARELRSQGMGFGSIGKELGISKSKAYSLASDEEVIVKTEGEAGFIDVIDRFQHLLRDYGVKDLQRVSEYVASQAADIFSDPQALRRALVDQMISPAKALSLTKMWASVEGLNIPQEMMVEAVGETGARQPDKWSLIGSTPTRDPDGPYTWLQCLQLLQASQQPQGENGGLKELRQEISSVRDELREERTKALTGQIATVAEKVTALNERLDHGLTGRTEMDILHEVATQGFGELHGLRGDVKVWLQSENLPPAKSTEEREVQKTRLGAAVKADAEIEAIGRRLFFREPQQGARAPQTTLTGSLGKTPAPREPEPPVLKAESRLVTCSRCQTTFDIDLAEAKQSVTAGKRLFVPCANPKCGFLLDISELLGLKPADEKPPAPECYEPGPAGCAAPAHRQNAPGHICKECAWRLQ